MKNKLLLSCPVYGILLWKPEQTKNLPPIPQLWGKKKKMNIHLDQCGVLASAVLETDDESDTSSINGVDELTPPLPSVFMLLLCTLQHRKAFDPEAPGTGINCSILRQRV